ncbi:RCC1 domain-containing protein [uncultured Aeromicrobium sp.]
MVIVAAGSTHTLGLCADGTIVSTGNNENGRRDVAHWSGLLSPN